ncbi:hypothetical protein O9929_24135 [Vibrio lentus]|nr:hypothetical protein [Vibrio lentus]
MRLFQVMMRQKKISQISLATLPKLCSSRAFCHPVLGSIYTGIASANRSVCTGCSWHHDQCACIRGELNFSMLKSAIATIRTCGMIMWIGIGANALDQYIYNLMGGIDFVEETILALRWR